MLASFAGNTDVTVKQWPQDAYARDERWKRNPSAVIRMMRQGVRAHGHFAPGACC
jgi:hypothetical protein